MLNEKENFKRDKFSENKSDNTTNNIDDKSEQKFEQDSTEEANNENYALTDQEQDKIIENEISYIRRFEYEFFVVNAGSAAYRGSGSSIATTTSNIDSQGTAYKIYACGMFFGKPNSADDPNNGEVEILIPLEHLIVMPS